MSLTAPVRWGILGTANIAARAFLPALRQAGGLAVQVGSRTVERATSWASEHGVERGTDYSAVLAAADLDAIYIALPNDLHVEWASAAAATGKAVLCEKPLALRPEQLSALLPPEPSHGPTWEAFVFPFHPQTARLQALIGDGELGTVGQLESEFHFQLTRPDNIRWSKQRGGGALLDVGCYPLRFARLIFGAEPVAAIGTGYWADSGVDAEVAALVDFPAQRRLVMSAGLRRPASTFCRIIGSEAELRLTNPFHPTGEDSLELWRNGKPVRRWAPAHGTAFEHAISHIHAVLRTGAAPLHTIASDARGQSAAVELVRRAVAVSVSDAGLPSAG